MIFPKWVEEAGDAERTAQNKLWFILRRSAMYHNRMGSIRELSSAIGYGHDYLHFCIKNGHVPHKCALALEAQLKNPEVFSAEMLNQ